jgi:hypothetical protein
MNITHRIERLGVVFKIAPLKRNDGLYDIILPLFVGSDIESLTGALLYSIHNGALRSFRLSSVYFKSLIDMANLSRKNVGIDDPPIVYTEQLHSDFIRHISSTGAFRLNALLTLEFVIQNADLLSEIDLREFEINDSSDEGYLN